MSPGPTHSHDAFGVELQILLLCSRTSLDSEAKDRARALLEEEGVDWDRLVQLATVHGVWPLLSLSLQSHFDGLVPPGVLDELTKRFQVNSRHNLALAWELVRILDHLSEKDIPAIPFKGPVLAVAAYGNLLARVFFDLDVMVRRKDLTRAREALAELGYQPRLAMTAAQEASYLRSSHEFGMLSADRKIAVELHWRFAPSHWPVRLDPDQLWERAGSVSLVGKSVATYAPEDLVLILAAHGTKHQWTRLDWLVGLAELIRSQPDLDWESVFRRARAVGLQRVVCLGLSLSETWLGAPLPEAVSKVASGELAVRRLAQRTTLRWLDRELPPGEWDSYILSARESWRDRMPGFLHTLRSRRTMVPGADGERRAGRRVSASLQLIRCLFGA